jgi:hypothetical protein
MTASYQQIHTTTRRDGTVVGDFGETGMQMFLQTHHCNSICEKLGLPLVAHRAAIHIDIGTKKGPKRCMRCFMEADQIAEGSMCRYHTVAEEKTPYLRALASFQNSPSEAQLATLCCSSCHGSMPEGCQVAQSHGWTYAHYGGV